MHGGAPKELGNISWGLATERESEGKMQLSYRMSAVPYHWQPWASQSSLQFLLVHGNRY